MTDPGELEVTVEEGASRLEAAAEALYHAHRQASEAELAYDKAFEIELLRIYDAAKQAGERMPAEDVRRAIAHRSMGEEAYTRHMKAKGELAGQEKLFKGLSGAVNARQSLLRYVGGGG